MASIILAVIYALLGSLIFLFIAFGDIGTIMDGFALALLLLEVKSLLETELSDYIV